MDFKSRLDRYLTTPPEDGFTDFWEAVVDSFTSEFWSQHEADIEADRDPFSGWINALYDREKSPEESARIIERAFRLFM